MILLKLILISLFIRSWLKSRYSSLVEPSDFFVLSFLLIYVPGFIFNPSGQTTLNGLHLPSEAATRAEAGMLIMLATGSMVFILRRYAERRFDSLTRRVQEISTKRSTLVIAGIAALCLAAMFSLLMISPEFRKFKLDILRFFSFQFEGSDYRRLRNESYSDGWIIEGILARARFTVLPILFCLTLYPFLEKKRLVFAAALAALIFVALPASLSKLPIFFFIGYAVILGACRYPRFLDIRFLAAMLVIATVIIVTMLVVLYTAQYQSAVINGTVLPLNLAIERIWGETYSVIVRYFTVYPEMLSYTGFGGINLLAKFFGLSARLPDIEVAKVLLGTDSGSNPGVYFLGGYAAFGMPGLVAYALLGALLLWSVDFLGRKIRVASLRATYLAVVGMNLVFLNQIALHTALVTYGIALVPITLLCLDILVRRIVREENSQLHGSAFS
ncbi:hypothetical protein [Herbaspirillum sp. C9C3]|uniref:hypothetical protein n=1 Tax=Herbaspirillum sp. C9C3 TaxID=2735271 RepID=UPI00158582F8|nr:hypothetical protein [Herbaspirillum sp. C9C3]NUT62018.1 hypothetical protein [Herbaspirillum sp. C9C3]